MDRAMLPDKADKVDKVYVKLPMQIQIVLLKGLITVCRAQMAQMDWKVLTVYRELQLLPVDIMFPVMVSRVIPDLPTEQVVVEVVEVAPKVVSRPHYNPTFQHPAQFLIPVILLILLQAAVAVAVGVAKVVKKVEVV